MHPSTLADATKEPFTGRVCDRVPRAERAAFLRALDRVGMLAARRAPLGKRSAFFAVRKRWDPERNWLRNIGEWAKTVKVKCNRQLEEEKVIRKDGKDLLK